MAASVIRTAEDYRDITYEYLAACAAEGAIYVELIASPDHAALVGLSDEDHLAGIAAGIDDARADHGIEARILLTCIRNFGVEQALRIARHAAERPHPYVVGFQMAGDEAGYPPGPFAEAYAIAAAAGLGCSVHAGEWAGAESVRAALDAAGHADRPRRAGDRGPRRSSPRSPSAGSSSSAARRATSSSACSRASRPTRCPALRDAGVRVTLASDDPPYFGASVGGEYAVARERFGLSDADLRGLTRTAIEASFAEPPLRAALLARLGDGDGRPT